MAIVIHKKEDFIPMRKVGKLTADLLDYIAPHVQPGVTTNYLNDLCHNYTIEHNAIPGPLNYKGFPKSVCTSVNHVVCHGIPSDKILKNGDIVNIDVSPILNGWYGDSSRSFLVGDKVSVKAKKLVRVTYEAMMIGIEKVKPGATIGDIGYAIQKYVEKNNFSVVTEYCGHGIGRTFHAEPEVPHYGSQGQGPVLEEGMFFTIEPMVNAGAYPTILSKLDGWTVTTRDKSLSAQFEHTMGVTSDGVEVFTLSKFDYDR